MRLRPLSLLLAPLWLLIAICVLSSCETPKAGPPAPVPGGGESIATARVITVVPAGTTNPGSPANTGSAVPPSPEPPTPLPTLASAGLSPTEMKYRILDQYPDFFFCDPDFYPVARADEGELAIERFPALQNDQEEFQAILAHNHLTGTTSFSSAQKQLIYREHKKLAALRLQLVADEYQFQIATSGQPSYSIRGVIDGSGRITVQQQEAGSPTCPICLAAHTRIDTPRGAVFVEDVKVGDSVWTLGGFGERLAAPVLKVARVPVSAGHELLHIVLDDGRELWASPGHPTADGRFLADLRAGDLLDGARVTLAEPYAYDGPATYDLLPAGSTSAYWANGILLGSTLGK
jgi:hypothetical protein